MTPQSGTNGDLYRAFAADYYEVELNKASMEHVFAVQPLDEPVVTALNADLCLADVTNDAAAIGYPVGA